MPCTMDCVRRKSGECDSVDFPLAFLILSQLAMLLLLLGWLSPESGAFLVGQGRDKCLESRFVV